MDVLSDAIAAMRLGRPHSARTILESPHETHFESQQGAGFHVILQGSCRLLPAEGEPLLLGVGDVVFLPRELGHGIAVPGEAGVARMLCGAYRLDQARAHPLFAELPEVVHVPARVGRHPSLQGAIELLGQELDRRTPLGGDAALPALLDLLLLYIVRAWYDDRPGDTATGWAAAFRDPAVAAALRGIHEAPERLWTVQSLAAHADLSRAAFARRFTDLVGSPPLTYLTWWRMTMAARLLRDTDLPLRAVAARTGYTSEFAFARAFKREFGAAPGQYRHGAATA
ncbi:AraC family transcriptional regulator [Actinomadura rudentiformis]|uniref:AraC family transcriptional regulator n=1 Tax=Actinomadura rudentiformis TaxID=359158 RepID=A0A6H9YGA2_9ACTN|nr:AraC family transcriptional regulator [Actinomadura rudentiformis]KAB2340986.1 AraC family transcriptional regulator [Actinomadura rudentiformis]